MTQWEEMTNDIIIIYLFKATTNAITNQFTKNTINSGNHNEQS
jgi:hypothetical protein